MSAASAAPTTISTRRHNSRMGTAHGHRQWFHSSIVAPISAAATATSTTRKGSPVSVISASPRGPVTGRTDHHPLLPDPVRIDIVRVQVLAWILEQLVGGK